MALQTFREYEIPAGKTPGDYRYRIDEIWDGGSTDILYTDSRAEVDRIVPMMLYQAYKAQVTDQQTGSVESFAD